MRVAFFDPAKKAFLPFQFDKEENTPEHSTERRAYRLVLKITRVFPISASRVGIG